jgi:hypothetical protein
MRQNQQIILIILFFANIFLLAHAVLPHSHHDGVVCFSLEELAHQRDCSNQHNDMGSCDCQQDNKGHHHTNFENCDLKNTVLCQQDSTHKKILLCINCLSLAYSLYSLNEFYLEAPQFGERFRHKTYSENYTTPFVGSTKNLRAPPVSYFLG